MSSTNFCSSPDFMKQWREQGLVYVNWGSLVSFGILIWSGKREIWILGISNLMNLMMTVIGFVVSTMFIFFVCTRFICARIHLNASRRSFPVIASRSHLSLPEQGFHGLEPVVVANFPKKKYSHELFSGAENYQCTVCLLDYHGEDILRILPYCGHSFHVTCIDIWLHQHSTCPVCRISLRE